GRARCAHRATAGMFRCSGELRTARPTLLPTKTARSVALIAVGFNVETQCYCIQLRSRKWEARFARRRMGSG
ncbi:MAG: hypothetical protein ACRD2L_20100, partial [Terriglobia bacterium]